MDSLRKNRFGGIDAGTVVLHAAPVLIPGRQQVRRPRARPGLL
ncbi:MAG TPA: hypothetical protein VNJ52_05935 [Patescibacteria group bacterium]|nr:hypothetical protein [Patescibacteria group bacterium]